MKQTLDFIIIGAQKAGTTSLAAYLSESPSIFIPPEKEVPYFLNRKMQAKGWGKFLDTYFHKGDATHLWGTSTPQYMVYPESFAAIRESLPDVKIIATMRDPIVRLLSHFDMATRFGVEARSLNRVIEEQLGHVDHYRLTPYPDRTGKYLVAGEYGRILSELFQYFDKSQVLLVDFEEIRKDTQQVVDHLSDFLGLNRFCPENLRALRMKGGACKKIPVDHNRMFSLLEKSSKSLGIAGLIPQRIKLAVSRLSSKLDEWNVDPTSKSRIGDLRPDLLDQLRQHYRHDAEKLENLGISIQQSWLRAWEGESLRGDAGKSGMSSSYD